MDEEWAIKILEKWIVSAEQARARNAQKIYDFAWVKSAEVTALREHEDQVRRVLARVMGSDRLPVILDAFSGDAVNITSGVEQCKYAIGRLKTQAETRAKLGSNAPTMAADALHPAIWNAASGRWDSGHYSDAVQRAATFLAADVQDRLGRRDVNDSDLMREAFSSSAPTVGKPRLRWPGADNDQTVKSMRVGILNYSQGVYSAIRNPATHLTADLERQEALEQLAALSMLARWIEKCEVITV